MITPLVIGKSANPRSLKHVNRKNVPVIYQSHKKAWMDREQFKRWFFEDFVPSVCHHLRKQQLTQRAILLIDNCPAHPNEETLTTSDGNIKALFLPKNATSILQPMDGGIIEETETLQEKPASSPDFYSVITIKESS